MANKTINLGAYLPLSQIREAIHLYGKDITIVVPGEPGIGKTSLLSGLAADNGDQWRKPGDYFPTDKRNYLYIDCTTEELGDRKMKIPVHATKKLEDYLAAELRLDEGKPLDIMLDEFMKCPKQLQVVWTRLMLERTIGNVPLPPGSRVFATCNNITDGLGDAIQAHVGNRIMLLPARKPVAREWVRWATDNNIDKTITAWVSATKRCLASYLDSGEENNEYIFNPMHGNVVSFVSPRSLAKADVIVKLRDKASPALTEAALAGTIGAAAAKGLMACIALNDTILKTEEVIAAPTAVPVPDDVLAQILMMIHGANDVETQDDVDAFMQFVERIPSDEIQSVFFHLMVTQTRTVMLVRNNKRLTKWRLDNFELIG